MIDHEIKLEVILVIVVDDSTVHVGVAALSALVIIVRVAVITVAVVIGVMLVAEFTVAVVIISVDVSTVSSTELPERSKFFVIERVNIRLDFNSLGEEQRSSEDNYLVHCFIVLL